MALYKYALSNRPAIGVMLSGPNLGDGLTNTGYTTSDSEGGFEIAPCPPIQATAEITGLWDAEALHSVSALTVWLAAATASGGVAQCNLGIGDPPHADTQSRHYWIEHSELGVSWTPLQDGALANSATIDDVSWAGTPFNARYLRVVVVADYYKEGVFIGSVTSVVYLNEIEVTSEAVGGCSSPSVPTGLAVGEVCSEGGDSLPVSWNASTGDPTITYQLQNVTASEIVFEGTGTSTTVTGLSVGVAYSFRVRGTNGCGTSDWSSAVEGTPNRAPEAPALVGERTSCGRYDVLTWAAVARATVYRLYRVVDGEDSLIYSGALLTFVEELTGLEREQGQTYTLLASGACGDSDEDSAETLPPFLVPGECDTSFVSGGGCDSVYVQEGECSTSYSAG